MHGPKPYKLTRFGDMHGPKPYKLKWFGDTHGPKPYKLRNLGDLHGLRLWGFSYIANWLPEDCASCGSKRPRSWLCQLLQNTTVHKL